LKLFLEIFNLCDHDTSTLRMDRETDEQRDDLPYSNTALCVASRVNHWL